MNKLDNQMIEIFQRHVEDIDESNALDYYQEIASGSAVYPGQGTSLGLIYTALKLNGEAGELAEHVGKAMRDDGLVQYKHFDGNPDNPKIIDVKGQGLTLERRELLIKEVGDVLWYLSAICRELDIKLSKAAVVNLVKLQDRQRRDKLSGSGDDR